MCSPSHMLELGAQVQLVELLCILQLMVPDMWHSVAFLQAKASGLHEIVGVAVNRRIKKFKTTTAATKRLDNKDAVSLPLVQRSMANFLCSMFRLIVQKDH